MVYSRLLDENRVKYYIFEKADYKNILMAKIYLSSVKAQQIHGVKIAVYNGEKKYYSGVDGILTYKRKFVGIRTADCLPILFTDKNNRFAEAVHAGWRGLYRGIIPSALSILECVKKDVLAVIGPHICGKCYKVSSEMKENFLAKYHCVSQCFFETRQGIHFDMALFAKYQLMKYGLAEKNIEILPYCTFCGNRFGSYRKEGVLCMRVFSAISAS